MFHPIEYVQERRRSRYRKLKLWIGLISLVVVLAATAGAWLALRGSDSGWDANSLPGVEDLAREESSREE